MPFNPMLAMATANAHTPKDLHDSRHDSSLERPVVGLWPFGPDGMKPKLEQKSQDASDGDQSTVAELPGDSERLPRASSSLSITPISSNQAHSSSSMHAATTANAEGTPLDSSNDDDAGDAHSTDSGSSLDDGSTLSPSTHAIGTAQTIDVRRVASPAGGDVTEPILEAEQIDSWAAQHKPIGRISSFRMPERTHSAYSISIMSSKRPDSRRSHSRRMPEFFSHAVFQTVLSSPTISHQLLKFSQSRLRGENMEFLASVAKYRASLAEVSRTIYEIHKGFVSKNAPAQVKLPGLVLKKTNEEMKSSLVSTVPTLEQLFTDAQSRIEQYVFAEIYPSFVRHQMSVSAAMALGNDRSRYAGLGDCFVLTDPAKADNPIVFASDGFVDVTGYSRNEIIPRNCRFLQSHDCDRAAIRRLKVAIDKRQESVELLLNRKRSGEPFWNLLYVTPLFDSWGNVVFFLGGQINCSTTIHNASDVMRILGQSKAEPNNAASGLTTPSQQSLPQPRRGILDRLRTLNRPAPQPAQREPGMENGLLGRIEDMSVQDQMQQFHRAYSNYLVINYSTFLIAFASAGLVDLLFAIKTRTTLYQTPPVGSDVFKFLANHSTGSLGSEYKTAVKRALKMGRPISLDLKLCAKPFMGLERFATHWTPLKDEVGAVEWVVLTLGNESRAG